ncbi:MAG: hypothetical protein DRI93_07190 [Aquificota bacterium]|nr:MAG: hypothetical protein DRI93_07190 [Aquificota bacterium]
MRKERQKVSVIFPTETLRKIKLIAALKEENTSQAIVRLTEKALEEELGKGEVSWEKLAELEGKIVAGGDALKDSEEVY